MRISDWSSGVCSSDLLVWPRLDERGARRVALLGTAVPLALMIVAWLRFDGDGGFELVESMSWIPSIGVSYRVGVDGLSLPLAAMRSEEHTSELQSLMRISYAVFCLKKKQKSIHIQLDYR